MLSNVQMVVAKKAIESTFTDLCSVAEYQEYERPNGSVRFEEVTTLKDQPCKLSFSTLNAASSSDVASALIQAPKLLISLDVSIKPGSKITVKKNGAIVEYKNAGQSGGFLVHQEIILELFKGWA